MYDQERTFRVYIADALFCIGNLNIRYSDMLNDKPEDTRTASEIISHIKEELGSMGGEHNGHT